MAGRHDDDMDVMMVRMADGVKGLLMSSSESFVVCALRSAAASWRTSRGSGGFGGRWAVDGPGDERIAMNCRRRFEVELTVCESAIFADDLQLFLGSLSSLSSRKSTMTN